MQKSGIKFSRMLPRTIVGLGLAIMSTDMAWGLASTTGCFYEDYTELPIGCTAASRQINCGTNYGVYVDCTACSSNYSLKSNTVTVLGTTYTYGSCTRNTVIVQCPSGCTSTSWTSAGTGKEVRCVKTMTTASCEYRCTAGYYGSGTTCSSCESLGSFNGLTGTSSTGSTSASSCCISSGSTFSFSDNKGKGTGTVSSTCCAS